MTEGPLEPAGFTSPFDAVAPRYDQGFGRSPAGRVSRFRLAERVVASMAPGATLLDVGAGTGEDAIWLAGQGFAVTGIDPSPGMLEEAARKSGVTGRAPVFMRTSVEAFAPGVKFDGVYSNFGAMNCVPCAHWREIAERLVAPGGRLLLVLMGRCPVPEALRRGPEAWTRRSGVTAPIGRREIRVEYPGAGEACRALGPAFHLERTETMGLLVPPAGMDGWPTRNPISFAAASAIECVIGRMRALCSFSDHYLLEFRRL